MGTDIHVAVEIRKKDKWELLKENLFVNPWYNPNNSNDKPTINFPYLNRNYDLFAMLADVRNGRGFGGCLTGTTFIPISVPKGYPEDMCPELKKEIDGDYDWDHDYYLSNEHSASYLTVEELLAYNWSLTHNSIGVVSEENYVNYCLKGQLPPTWCGGVCGPNIKTVSELAMKAILNDPSLREKDTKYYVQTVFPAETYAEAAGSFYTETLPILKKLAENYGPTNVRIVFDFDS